MEIRQLESVLAVIAAGTFTEASRRLHLSQPALSQQISLLEEELGESLFLRNPRGVEPTSAGLLFAKHAQRILSEIHQTQQQFTSRKSLQTGSLHFGIIPTIAPYLLPRLLAPFRQKSPELELSVTEEKTPQLIEKIATGQLEFAIVSDIEPALLKRTNLQIRALFHEPLLLATAPNHPLALQKNRPSPTDISPEELILLSDGHCLATHSLSLCKAANPNTKIVCDQLITILAMVAENMGVSIIPKLAASLAPPNVTLRPFRPGTAKRMIGLLSLRNHTPSPAARELLRDL